MADIFTVANKEFSDMIKSRRFIILIVIFGLIMTIAMATIYIRVVQTMPNIPGVHMPRGFLGMMAFMLTGTLSNFAPVMGLALGCDAISGEREKGTLKIVLAQPVFRDTIINGKFLAATLAVSLAILITSLISIGASTLIIGVTPTAEETMRMALFLLFSILFTMTYYGIAVFLSTIMKKTSHSVILSVTIWALFTFVIPIIASLIAITIAPPTIGPREQATQESIKRFTSIVETITSITPNYHYNKIGQYILSPYSTTQPQERSTIMNSLTYAAPNIIVLAIITALAFIASYITFTRQEVK